MPFSDRAGEGFENKIAELVAARLNARLEYAWWPQRKSFVKHTLDENACDVVMGVPVALADVLATEPYYRSTYVFVSRRDRKLSISSLADPRLANLRIGIHVIGDDYAPPSYALAREDITRNIVPFSLLGEYGEVNPPRKLIDAVEAGQVDIGIVWGPFAGYFAKSAKAPLEINPVNPKAFLGIPFTYEMAAGVRKGNERLKDELDQVFAAEAAAIARILSEFAVPQAP